MQAQPELNRLAFVYYVLARAGQPNVAQTGQMFDNRLKLSLYARGYLAQAMHLIDPGDPRLATLVADFTSQAGLSASGAHWNEPDPPDYWNWNTDTRTTAIILAALVQVDPQNELLPNVARWLMANRTSGRWGGTQETAWALMALTDWMVVSGDLQANYAYEATVNGQTILAGRADPGSANRPVEASLALSDLFADTANRLVVARDDGSGSLNYTAQLAQTLPVAGLPAQDRGVAVTRSYYRAEDRQTPVSSAAQGDLLIARLSIVVPHDLHYVVVEDPLPAGLEAVDTSLLTSIQTGAPNLDNWESDPYSGYRGWGWWIFRHVELRDEMVVLSVDYLPAGTYEYAYLVRAATPGRFSVIPTTASEFYFPEVYGRGEGMMFEVLP